MPPLLPVPLFRLMVAWEWVTDQIKIVDQDVRAFTVEVPAKSFIVIQVWVIKGENHGPRIIRPFS